MIRQPRLAVIILHYTGTQDTLACLDSIMRGKDSDLDVILVENGLTEPIASCVSERFPEVILLQLAENRGWAGGNNAGIALARDRDADIVCLLNNDTIVPANAMRHLARQAAAFGPCLLTPAIDFLDPQQGAQLDPSGWRNAAPLPGHDSLYALSYAYGACLVIPTSVLEQVGLLDERFFLQLEETDFFERARTRGIPSICDVSIRILHAESRAFGSWRTPVKTYYIIRNGLLLVEKLARYPKRSLAILKQVYRNVVYAYSPPNSSRQGSILTWLVSNDPYACAVRRGLRDYLMRRFGRAPSDVNALKRS